MNYYALFYDVVPDYVSRRVEYREEHQRLAQEAHRRGQLLRGSVYAAQRRHQEAIADFDVCLQFNPKLAEAWQRRGEEHFKARRD